MTQYNANAMVRYSASDYQNGSLLVDNSCIPYSKWLDWYNPIYHHWHPTYTLPSKSKLEQAFKITQKLMEKQIIKGLKLKQFIELVNEIANIV